jgi:hypothetical protein
MTENITRRHQAALMVAMIAATSCAAVALAGSAPAGPLVLDEDIEVARCGQDSGQRCPPVIYRQAYINTPIVKVEFTASAAHCSDVIAHVFVDGREWGSNVVAPGASDGGFEIPMDKVGLHKFGVQAEGVTGGCNTGKLESWSGNLHIEELPA